MEEFEKYGKFDDKNKEYIITDPFPPTTWINYLSNGNLTAIMSQKAGGLAFLDQSPAEMRLTRYQMGLSLPVDRPGFYIYLREKDGTVWSPTYEPVRQKLDSWKCRQGMGYTIFESSFKKLNSTTRFFIAPDDNVLVWELTLENNRSEDVEMLISPYVEFSFLDAVEEHFYFHWGRMANSFTYDDIGAVKYYYGHQSAKRRAYTYFTASEKPDTFDCNRETFIGRAGTQDMPESMIKGKLAENQLPGGGYGVGALGFNVSIKPGEKRKICFYLGVEDTWEDAEKTIIKYRDTSNVDSAWGKLNNFYDEYFSTMKVNVPDNNVERFVNIWNPYNCRTSYENRFISAIHTGLEGGTLSRDSMQDAMSISHLKPEWAKSKIELIFKYQQPSGKMFTHFDPKSPQKPNDNMIRSDNTVWSIFTTYSYLSETGDFDFLDEKIPYYEGEDATIFEHLYKGLKYIVDNSGPHGLPLMFNQDWNDHLFNFKGEGVETVMLAQQVAYASTLLKEIAKIYKNEQVVNWCKNEFDRLYEILNSDLVWDGKWYKRIIFPDDRIPLGSNERYEAKLYLNTQSWAIISGTAPKERADLCIASIEEHLETPYGFKLLWPHYTGIPEHTDPLKGNAPGVSENAGVFNHANTWAIMAASVGGYGEKAFNYYNRTLPPNVIKTVGADKYLNEPYIYSSHIITDPDPRAGTALLSWLTGTATWMYIASTQYIMGIKPMLNGLYINPSISDSWESFSIDRMFRGVNYKISISNPNHVFNGVKSITVDGTKIDGLIIPIIKDKKEVIIEVVMG